MSKQVEELVEWVAKIVYGEENYNYFEDLDTLSWYKEKYHNKAKQILSHPDLALIDRDKRYPDAHFVNGLVLLGEKFRVIPLAQALKELPK